MTEQTGGSLGFNIPKIKRQRSKDNLRTVEINSRDVQDLTSTIERSYLDRTYKAPWRVKAAQIVDNKELESQYRAKRLAMKEEGRHARELQDHYAYLLINDTRHIIEIAQYGIKARSSASNALGDSKLGIYVCKHADIQLRLAENSMYNTCCLIVFKVILGRCKSLLPQKGADVEPTPNYDCHVSQDRPKPNDSLKQQVLRSQIYIYEYNEDCETLDRPRHCIPHAVITYERSGIIHLSQNSKSWYSSGSYSSRSTSFNRSLSSGNEKVRQMSRAAFERRVAEEMRMKQRSLSADGDPVSITKPTASESSEQESSDKSHSTTLSRDTSSTPLSPIVVHNTLKSVTVHKTRADPRVAMRARMDSGEDRSQQMGEGSMSSQTQLSQPNVLLQASDKQSETQSHSSISDTIQSNSALFSSQTEFQNLFHPSTLPYDLSPWQQNAEKSSLGVKEDTFYTSDPTVSMDLTSALSGLYSQLSTVISSASKSRDTELSETLSHEKKDTEETPSSNTGLDSSNSSVVDVSYNTKLISHSSESKEQPPCSSVAASEIDERKYSKEHDRQTQNIFINEMGDIDERSSAAHSGQSVHTNLTSEYAASDPSLGSQQMDGYKTEYSQWYTPYSDVECDQSQDPPNQESPDPTSHTTTVGANVTEGFGSVDVIDECSMDLDSDYESSPGRNNDDKTQAVPSDNTSQKSPVTVKENLSHVDAYGTSGVKSVPLEKSQTYPLSFRSVYGIVPSMSSKKSSDIKGESFDLRSPYSTYLTEEEARKILPESPLKPNVVSYTPTSIKPVVSYTPTSIKSVVGYTPTSIKPVVGYTPTSIKPVVSYTPTSIKPVVSYTSTSTEPVASYTPTSLEPVASYTPTSTEPVASYTPTSVEPVASYTPTTTEPVASYTPTSVEPVASYTPTSVEPVASYTPTTTEPDASYTPTSVEPVASYTSTSAEPVASYTPTSVEPVASYTPTSVEPVASYTPTSVEPVASYTPTSVEPVASYTPTSTKPRVDNYQPLIEMDYMQNTTTGRKSSSPSTNIQNLSFLQTVNLDISNLKNILQNINVSPTTSPTKDKVSPMKALSPLAGVKRQLSYEEKNPEARFDAYCTSNQSRTPPVQVHRSGSTEYDTLVSKINNLQAEIEHIKKKDHRGYAGSKSAGNSPAVGWNSPKFTNVHVQSVQPGSGANPTVTNRRADILEDISYFTDGFSESHSQIPGLDLNVRLTSDKTSQGKSQEEGPVAYTTSHDRIPSSQADSVQSLPLTTSYTVTTNSYTSSNEKDTRKQPTSIRQFYRDTLLVKEDKGEKHIPDERDNTLDLPEIASTNTELKIGIPFLPSYESTPIKQNQESAMKTEVASDVTSVPNSEVKSHVVSSTEKSQPNSKEYGTAIHMSEKKMTESQETKMEVLDLTGEKENKKESLDETEKKETEMDKLDVTQNKKAMPELAGTTANQNSEEDYSHPSITDRSDSKESPSFSHSETSTSFGNHSGSSTDVSSQSSGKVTDTPDKLTQKPKPKPKKNKDMMGYRTRKRRRKKQKCGKDDSQDNQEVASLMSTNSSELLDISDLDLLSNSGTHRSSDRGTPVYMEHADVTEAKGRLTLDDFGLKHWSQAQRHPLFQPEVVLRKLSQKEIDMNQAFSEDTYISNFPLTDMERAFPHMERAVPHRRDDMVKQWIEGSRKKIKIVLKCHSKSDGETGKQVRTSANQTIPVMTGQHSVVLSSTSVTEVPVRATITAKQSIPVITGQQSVVPPTTSVTAVIPINTQQQSVVPPTTSVTAVIPINTQQQSVVPPTTSVTAVPVRTTITTKQSIPAITGQQSMVPPTTSSTVVPVINPMTTIQSIPFITRQESVVPPTTSVTAIPIKSTITTKQAIPVITGQQSVVPPTTSVTVVPVRSIITTKQSIPAITGQQSAVPQPTSVTTVIPVITGQQSVVPHPTSVTAVIPAITQQQSVVPPTTCVTAVHVRTTITTKQSIPAITGQQSVVPPSTNVTVVPVRTTTTTTTMVNSSGNTTTRIPVRFSLQSTKKLSRPLQQSNFNLDESETMSTTTTVSAAVPNLSKISQQPVKMTSANIANQGIRGTTLGTALSQSSGKSTTPDSALLSNTVKSLTTVRTTLQQASAHTYTKSLYSTTGSTSTTASATPNQSTGSIAQVRGSSSQIISGISTVLSTKVHQPPGSVKPQSQDTIVSQENSVKVSETVAQKGDNSDSAKLSYPVHAQTDGENKERPGSEANNFIKGEHRNNIENDPSQSVNSKALSGAPKKRVITEANDRVSPITVIGESKPQLNKTIANLPVSSESSQKTPVTLTMTTLASRIIAGSDGKISAISVLGEKKQPGSATKSIVTKDSSITSTSSSVISFTSATVFSSAAPDSTTSSYSGATQYPSTVPPITTHTADTANTRISTYNAPVPTTSIQTITYPPTSLPVSQQGTSQTIITVQTQGAGHTDPHNRTGQTYNPHLSTHPYHSSPYPLPAPTYPQQPELHQPPAVRWPHLPSSLPHTQYLGSQHGTQHYPYPSAQSAASHHPHTYTPTTTSSVVPSQSNNPPPSIQSQPSTTGTSTKRPSSDVMDWFTDKIAPKKRQTLDISPIAAGTVDSISKTPGTPNKSTDLWDLAFSKSSLKEDKKSTSNLDYFLGSGNKSTKSAKKRSKSSSYSDDIFEGRKDMLHSRDNQSDNKSFKYSDKYRGRTFTEYESRSSRGPTRGVSDVTGRSTSSPLRNNRVSEARYKSGSSSPKLTSDHRYQAGNSRFKYGVRGQSSSNQVKTVKNETAVSASSSKAVSETTGLSTGALSDTPVGNTPSASSSSAKESSPVNTAQSRGSKTTDTTSKLSTNIQSQTRFIPSSVLKQLKEGPGSAKKNPHAQEDLDKSSIDNLAKRKELLQKQLKELEFGNKSKNVNKDSSMNLIEISDEDEVVMVLSDVEEGEIIDQNTGNTEKGEKGFGDSRRVVTGSGQDSRVVVAVDTGRRPESSDDTKKYTGKFGEEISITVTGMLNKENMDRNTPQQRADKRRIISLADNNKKQKLDDVPPHTVGQTSLSQRRRGGSVPNVQIQDKQSITDSGKSKSGTKQQAGTQEVVPCVKSPTVAHPVATEWSDMLRRKDTAVEKVRCNPQPKRRESIEMEIKSIQMAQKEEMTVVTIKKSQKMKRTLREWIKEEYKDIDIAQFEKLTKSDLNLDIMQLSKNQRKSLKNRVKKEIQLVKQKCVRIVTAFTPPDTSTVTDKAALEIKPFEQLPFSKQVLQQELIIVRLHLRKLMKSAQVIADNETKAATDEKKEEDPQKSSGLFSLRQDLQQIESDLVQRINIFHILHGAPNRRIPDELLTTVEKTKHMSEENLVLVSCATIPVKAYQRLRKLKYQMENDAISLEEAERTNNAQLANSLKMEMEKSHTQRKSIMLTFTGPLSKKRISKIRLKAKCYRNCIEYFRKELGHFEAETKIKFLIVSLQDLDRHFSLVTQLQNEAERKQKETMRQDVVDPNKQRAVVQKIKNDLGIVHNKLSFMSFKYAKNSSVKEAIANILKRIKEALDLIGPESDNCSFSPDLVIQLTEILQFSISGYEDVKKQIDQQ